MKAEKRNIQWEQTYVAGNKTFCIDLTDDEGLAQNPFVASQLRKLTSPTIVAVATLRIALSVVVLLTLVYLRCSNERLREFQA